MVTFSAHAGALVAKKAMANSPAAITARTNVLMLGIVPSKTNVNQDANELVWEG
jgi:hypothetical protein